MADYELEGPSWNSNTVTWSFAQTNYPNQPAQFGSYFGSGLFTFEIQAAFQRWASVANISFVQVADSSTTDIRLGLASMDGPYGTLGDATYRYSGEIFLSGAVVRFDSDESYTVTNGAETLRGGVTFRSVALHEIGHVLGLGHYDGGPAVMNTTTSPSIRDLLPSDINGIRALYGAPVVSSLSPGGDDYTGTNGADRVLALDGNDTLRGSGGSDMIYGNRGADLIYGNQGDDVLFGGQDGDVLVGGQGGDIVYGNLGDDVIYGNLANDIIYGGQGRDVILGGQGNDLLIGNLGDDTMSGNLGADRFVFGQNAGADLILGFDQAQGDRLDFGGQGYAVADDGRGGTLFTLSGGGSVNLANVRPSDVHGGFFA